MSKAIRVRIRTWPLRVTAHLAARFRGETPDRGAGAIEYAGIVILVAGIILAIRALGLPAQISGAIKSWVSAVVGG